MIEHTEITGWAIKSFQKVGGYLAEFYLWPCGWKLKESFLFQTKRDALACADEWTSKPFIVVHLRRSFKRVRP